MRYHIILCTIGLIFMMNVQPQKIRAAETDITELKLPNPGFELGATGFLGNMEMLSGKAHSGSYYIRQKYEPGNNWNCIQSLPPFLPCQAGEVLDFSVWSRNTVGIGDIFMGIRFIKFVNGKATTIGYRWQLVGNNLTTWTQYTMTAKAPVETAAAALYFRIDSSVKDGEIYWDDLTVKRGKEKLPDMTLEPLTSPIINSSRSMELYDFGRHSWTAIDTTELPVTVKLNRIITGASLSFRITESTGKATPYYQTIVLDPEQKELTTKLKPKKTTDGKYRLTVTLNQNGKIIQQESKDIFFRSDKLSPLRLEPIRTSRIDSDGNILINGKPFSMYFYFHNPLNEREMTALHRNFGVNAAQVWGGNSIDELCRKVDLVWKCGVYSWAVLFHEATFDEKAQKWKDDALIETVNRLKNHPGLIGWDLVDEPDARSIPPEEVRRVRDLIRKLDPNHLIWVNLCLPPKFPAYADCSDLASYDVYPFPNGSLRTISAHNQAIISANRSQTKPLICCLQTYSQPANRPPTYEEIKAEVYLCIVEGMKSFSFYAWSDPPPVFSLDQSMELQSYLQGMIADLKKLEPFLAEPTPPQPIIVAADHLGLRYLFKKVAGEKILLLVNPEAKSKKVTFPLPDYTRGEITFPFASDPIEKTSEGNLNLEMAPWQVLIIKY